MALIQVREHEYHALVLRITREREAAARHLGAAAQALKRLGQALALLKADTELWRSRAASWKAFCPAHLGMSRQYVYSAIGVAHVIEALELVSAQVDTSQHEARALAGLSPEEQIEAYTARRGPDLAAVEAEIARALDGLTADPDTAPDPRAPALLVTHRLHRSHEAALMAMAAAWDNKCAREVVMAAAPAVWLADLLLHSLGLVRERDQAGVDGRVEAWQREH